MTDTKIKFNFLTELTEEDLKYLQNELKSISREKEEEKMRAAVDSHMSLVGKCFKTHVQPYSKLFPEMWRYYKIINARASNQYRVSALRFDEYPTYWFKYQASKIGHAGDYYFGDYEFTSIIVEDFPFFCYDLKTKNSSVIIGDKLTEISLTEYNEAMNKYIERLQKLNWPADHYRYGNKMPTDKEWEKKKKWIK